MSVMVAAARWLARWERVGALGLWLALGVGMVGIAGPWASVADAVAAGACYLGVGWELAWLLRRVRP